MAEEVYLVDEYKDKVIKKLLAKKLYKKGFEQSKIAQLLNLSQPMVSNYLKDNLEEKYGLNKQIDSIVEKIYAKENIGFQTIIHFSEKPIFGKYYLAKKTEIINDDKKFIIDNLLNAFQILKNQDLNEILPKIKINIAMGKINANKSEDIASFVNGLVISDDKIVANNGIRFGKSKHLSNILLKFQKRFQINAIMNIANIKNLKKIKLKYGFLTNDYKIKNKAKDFDILVHKGDFGIEPCTYVIGKDAVDVANKVLMILDEVNQ